MTRKNDDVRYGMILAWLCGDVPASQQGEKGFRFQGQKNGGVRGSKGRRVEKSKSRRVQKSKGRRGHKILRFLLDSGGFHGSKPGPLRLLDPVTL